MEKLMIKHNINCNICNGDIFDKGPGGRLSFYGKLPFCMKCGSLERHRSFRDIWERIKNNIDLKSKNALQISIDGSVPSNWFKNLEVSIYNGINSLDIQNIERNDNSYDIVICNHVLEHVENAELALKELLRITKNNGFLQLSVPDPFRNLNTNDWGYPKEEDHGHYRIYGQDIFNLFHKALPGIYLLTIVSIDEVTGSEDVLFLFSKDINLRALYPDMNMKYFQKLGNKDTPFESFSKLIPEINKNKKELFDQSIRLFFWPDYTVTNSYQKLLYEFFPLPILCGAGNLSDAIYAINKFPGDIIFFHLHWTGTIFSNVSSVSDVINKLNVFFEQIIKYKLLGGKIIWTIHNVFNHESIYFDQEVLLHKFLVEQSDLIHIHSPLVLDIINPYFTIPEDKVVVAYHGNYLTAYPNTLSQKDAKEILNIPLSSRVLLFFGQIRKYKGIEELISGFLEVSKEEKNIHLIIVGDSTLMSLNELKTLISNNKRIHLFDGYIKDEDIQIYFNASDVTVLPYKHVLTSGSVLLSLSFNLPVIAPDLGILKSVINNTKDGWLYDSSDPFGLIDCIKNFVSISDEDLNKYKENSLSKAKHFNWKTSSKNISEKILELSGSSLLKINTDIEHTCLVRLTDKKKDIGRTAIVIVHYKNIEDTITCINNIASLTSLNNVYIVSNDEDYITYFTLYNKYQDLNIIQSGSNIGFAEANNIAISLVMELNYDFIWLVNPDMIIENSDVLIEFEKSATNLIDYDIFGSIITYTENPNIIWYAGGEVNYQDGFNVTHSFMGKTLDLLPESKPWDTTYITGASMFFRKKLINLIGFLPRQFFLYFEETHWCLLAKEKGHRLAVLPNIILKHHKRSELKGVPSLTYLYYFSRNWILMTKIWNPKGLNKSLDELNLVSEQWFDIISKNKPEILEKSMSIYRIALEDGLNDLAGFKNIEEL
jgi:GT2 family glycosyltransferase/glycosyltransferase involved in cell wall biosynthesis